MRKLAPVISVAILLTAPSAQAEGLGAIVDAGMLGVEFSANTSSHLSDPAGTEFFGYDFSDEFEGIDLGMKREPRPVAAMLDWHPAGGSFQFSGGMLFNQNELSANARPDESRDIGRAEYPAALVGELTGDVDFDVYAPYIGLGWATDSDGDGGLGMSLDLGVAYQGQSDATFADSGPMSANPGLQAERIRAQRVSADDLDDFNYYPLVAVGFSYRF